MTDTLPTGWVDVELPVVAELIMGQSPPSNTYNTAGNGLPFFQGKTEFGDIYPTVVKFCSLPLRVAEQGDILISVRAPVGPTNLCQQRSCIGRGLAAIRPRGGIPSRYLLYYLRSVEGWLSQQGTGSTFTAISKTDLEQLTVSVAPLAEQRRIVARLDELLKKMDSCQKRLTKTPMVLKRFRQSVLATACSGRLTSDWRKRNPRNEPVDVTVETIRRRREGEAETVTQREKLREIFSASEENDSGELPESWRYITLSKLCSSFDYGTSAKSKPSGTVPVLRMGNIQSGKIDWTDLVYTSGKEEIERYSLQPNTVLFNRTNSPELVGKTAIYHGEQPAIFAGYLIRVNAFPELDPKYLNLCLNTNYAKEFCARVKTDGVSQSNINAKKLGAFELPFCPPAEQREIVRQVEALFALADTIETRLREAQAYIDQLTPSLLSRAFRGDLVPTEAELARRESRDYESALALLERIHREPGRAARKDGKLAEPRRRMQRASRSDGGGAVYSKQARVGSVSSPPRRRI